MALGLVVGPLLGPRATPLGELGRLVIQLIKAVATPLVFFAIVNAILKTRLEGRAGVRMLALAMMNACIALGIGLLLSNLLHPGRSLDLAQLVPTAGAQATYQGKTIDLLQTF